MVSRTHDDQGFSPNAIRILKARYYLKDDKGGFLDRSPADLFRRVAGVHRRRRKGRGRAGPLGRILLQGHDGPGLPPQQPDPDRRRSRHVPQRLLRPAHRGFAGLHIRNGQERRPGSQGRRRDRLRFQRAPAHGQFRPQDPGHRLGTRLLPEGHRRRDRGGQAGRNSPGRQYGRPAGRPPRHRGIHRHEAGRPAPGQFQHLGGHHRRVHPRPERGRRLRRSATRTKAGRPGPRRPTTSSI